MSIWLRPDGTEIEVNDRKTTENYLNGNGWKKLDDKNDNMEFDAISEMESKEQIEAYVLEKAGVNIDKRGGLETVREKARAVLNGNSI